MITLKKLQLVTLSLAMCGAAYAQQSNVNLSHNPQLDTEGLIPFSASLNSPQVNDDHTVIFRIKAPKAKEVKLSGAMLTVMHEKSPLPFTKGKDGIWTLKIGPLPVDMYQYNINIDGVSTADPNNTYAAFTAMPPYSELIVHGDGPQWYDAKPVPHGAITRHIYTSHVTGGERDMYVYTPPTFDPKREYPVLYLMGGSGELPSNWMYDGRVNFIMDNLLADGKATPMIIAIINNQVVHRNHPKHADLSFDIMARELREVIVPFVDAHYNTIANPHGRAISGLSMGGRHTMFSGMEQCLDLFANFGVLSAGDNDPDKSMPKFMNTKDVNDKIDYLFVGQGTEEEAGMFNVRVKGFVEGLKAHNIKHEYYVGGRGGHDWSTWRHLLYYRFLPNLFKKNETQDIRDIVFAEAPTDNGGTKQLKLNIWKGAGDGPHPVVFFVHGGAWVAGDNNLDKSGSQQIKAIMQLRECGVTIAASTYRFSNEAIFPAQIHDVKAAIRYLKANAETYDIDPNRIMTMGESAGAMLALLAAVSNGEEAMEGNVGGNTNVDSNVIGCVDCYGMTDFTTLAADLYTRPDLGRTDAQVYELVEDKTSSRSQLFGLTSDKVNLGTVTAKPKRFPGEYALVKSGSPLFHVSPNDPPILIINGQRDIRVPSAQAEKMYEALYSAGVEAELILNDRAPHGDLGTEAEAAIKAFVKRILFPK